MRNLVSTFSEGFCSRISHRLQIQSSPQNLGTPSRSSLSRGTRNTASADTWGRRDRSAARAWRAPALRHPAVHKRVADGRDPRGRGARPEFRAGVSGLSGSGLGINHSARLDRDFPVEFPRTCLGRLLFLRRRRRRRNLTGFLSLPSPGSSTGLVTTEIFSTGTSEATPSATCGRSFSASAVRGRARDPWPWLVQLSVNRGGGLDSNRGFKLHLSFYWIRRLIVVYSCVTRHKWLTSMAMTTVKNLSSFLNQT